MQGLVWLPIVRQHPLTKSGNCVSLDSVPHRNCWPLRMRQGRRQHSSGRPMRVQRSRDRNPSATAQTHWCGDTQPMPQQQRRGTWKGPRQSLHIRSEKRTWCAALCSWAYLGKVHDASRAIMTGGCAMGSHQREENNTPIGTIENSMIYKIWNINIFILIFNKQFWYPNKWLHYDSHEL